MLPSESINNTLSEIDALNTNNVTKQIPTVLRMRFFRGLEHTMMVFERCWHHLSKRYNIYIVYGKVEDRD